ncbi:hypothetical protein [Actinoalloteichus caeruleus]|uniref:DUF7937 domain-containing protein n=1 Tax=Actinoalloteichus cyanogriseus TaxID=2893586 RepID=UPI0004C0F3E4|nr:hypothetical protein [Actinoalloteichus caeruleus]
MNFCGECGHPAGGGRFCVHCGERLAATVQAGMADGGGGAASAEPRGPADPPPGPHHPTPPPDAPATVPNPFTGVHWSDFVRDGVALVLLLVPLALPWTFAEDGADRLEVVLVTLVSLASLSVFYLARIGTFGPSVGPERAWLLRLVLNTPYLVVVVVTVVLDVVNGDATTANASLVGGGALTGAGGGLGAGVAMGLAGAVLALSPRWAETSAWSGRRLGERWRVVGVAVSGLAAVLLVASSVVFLAGDVAGAAGGPLVAALVLASASGLVLVAVVLVGLLRRDHTLRRVAVMVGVVVLLASSFTGHQESLWIPASGLVFLPAAVVAASVPAVLLTLRPGPLHLLWFVTARRALELAAVVTAPAFVGVVLMMAESATDRGAKVAMLVCQVLVVVAAITARSMLLREPRQGRVAAVAVAGVLLLLGVIQLAVEVSLSDAVSPYVLLIAFGVPGLVVLSLTAPAPVRAYLRSLPVAGPPPGWGGAGWGAPVDAGRPAGSQPPASTQATSAPVGSDSSPRPTPGAPAATTNPAGVAGTGEEGTGPSRSG